VGINLGLDIGAISLKLAAVGTTADVDRLEWLCASRPEFHAVPGSDRPLVVSDCVRITGSPIQTTYDLLLSLYDAVPEVHIEGIRVTGSGGRTIARILGIYYENEFKATAHAVGRLYPRARTVFEIGGESSRFLRLDPGHTAGTSLIVDYDRGGECAAGTGSFLDQQAARLGYSVAEFSVVARTATRAARIAGRCSVFAKSDMVHAQQKGWSPGEILRGLCRAVAQNFKSSVVKGRSVEAPVLFIGGVAGNAGVVEALREAFDLDERQMIVPPLYESCGAIGAAMLEAEETRRRSFGEIHRLQQHASQVRAFDGTPLTLDRVVRLTPDAYEPPADTTQIHGYLGIDVGSVSTNLVVIDEGGTVVHDIYLRTAGRPLEAVQQGLAGLAERWGARLMIAGVGTTGSGRELAAEFIGADVVRDEITAHKTGALHVSRARGGVLVDTIFEIGGQDSKFIALEDGVVVDFTMNEACAAGTGSFLEEQAEKLGIGVKEEFARLALSSNAPARMGERCTVFMERDVTTALHNGATLPDLLAALAYSIALNYLNRVVRGRHIGGQIYFQGGTAYNDAVAAAFAAILGKTITVPPYNGVIGALGMALIARDWSRRQASGEELPASARHPETESTGFVRTRFRGYNLSLVDQKTRDFVCRACSNECDIKEFTVEDRKSYWGDKCSDRYRKPAMSAREPVIPDLFELRDRLIEEITGQTRAYVDRVEPGPISVGIPSAMTTIERYPFWHTYFAALGLRPIPSRPTDKKIAAEGVELSLAAPCFPVQVAHGHVRALFDLGVDYVLVPNMLDNETHAESPCVAHYCPWTQTLPWVLRAAPGIDAYAGRVLAPRLHFQSGPSHVKDALGEMVRRFGLRRRSSDAAVDAAYAAQRLYQERLLEMGRRALDDLERAGAPGILLVGRPYNIYDRNVNCDIPRKLRRHYGANVIPLDFLATGREAIHELHGNMFWTSGQKMLQAARVVASNPRLHMIFFSNFKCGPDSYIKHYTHQASGTSLLVLQFDGHGNDAGYLTRCEAYLDSKGILQWHPDPRAVGSAATPPTR
jgi:predicted CoA-substrate-specific enzyme activase